MQITVNIDLEKFRYSLVGDGFTKDEVEKFSEEDLIQILEDRVTDYVNKEYYRGRRLGLYD